MPFNFNTFIDTYDAALRRSVTKDSPAPVAASSAGTGKAFNQAKQKLQIGSVQNQKLFDDKADQIQWTVRKRIFDEACKNSTDLCSLILQEGKRPKRSSVRLGITFAENLPTITKPNRDDLTRQNYDALFHSALGCETLDPASVKAGSTPTMAAKLLPELFAQNNASLKSDHSVVPIADRRTPAQIAANQLSEHCPAEPTGCLRISTDELFNLKMLKLETARVEGTPLFVAPSLQEIKEFREKGDVIAIRPTGQMQEHLSALDFALNNVEERIRADGTPPLGNIFSLLRNENGFDPVAEGLMTEAEREYVSKFETAASLGVKDVANTVFGNQWDLHPLAPNINNGVLIQDRREAVTQEWHVDKAGDVSVVFAMRKQDPTVFVPAEHRDKAIDGNGIIDPESCARYADTDSGKGAFLVFPQDGDQSFNASYPPLVHASPNDTNAFRFVFSADFQMADSKAP